jgi:Lar family restriction alleviation protein
MTSTFKDGIELLPCPFCGCEAEIREGSHTHDTWFVRCTACQIKTVISYTKDEPISEWNKRTSTPEQSIAVALSPLNEAWEEFKRIYISIGGTRNPRQPHLKGWSPAKPAFDRAAKDHDPRDIIHGTIAYAAYMRKRIAADPSEARFVPAPRPFLNDRKFTWTWDGAQCAKPAAPSMFDVAQSLTER